MKNLNFKRIAFVYLCLTIYGTANATSYGNNGQSQGQLQTQGQGQSQEQSSASYSNSGSYSNSIGYGGGGVGFASAVGGGDSSASTGDSSANSKSTGGNATSGNSGALVNINNPATDLSRGVGVAVAPSVYNSMATCMGGVSAAGGFAGGAFSLGASIESDPCNVRQFAVLVDDRPDLQKAVFCQNPMMKEAYKNIGEPCLDRPATLSAAQAKANSEARMARLAQQYAERTTSSHVTGWQTPK